MPEPVAADAAPEPADDPSKPKRRGWWSIGR
jgi:ribonuclease E